MAAVRAEMAAAAARAAEAANEVAARHEAELSERGTARAHPAQARASRRPFSAMSRADAHVGRGCGTRKGVQSRCAADARAMLHVRSAEHGPVRSAAHGPLLMSSEPVEREPVDEGVTAA